MNSMWWEEYPYCPICTHIIEDQNFIDGENESVCKSCGAVLTIDKVTRISYCTRTEDTYKSIKSKVQISLSLPKNIKKEEKIT